MHYLIPPFNHILCLFIILFKEICVNIILLSIQCIFNVSLYCYLITFFHTIKAGKKVAESFDS